MIALLITAYVLLALAFLGCFIAKINGPLLAFIGILLLQYGTDVHPFTTTAIVICALAVAACYFLDKVAKNLIQKLHSFGKGGKWGASIGAWIGICLICAGGKSTMALSITTTVGLLVLPYVFGLLGEYIAQKNFSQAVKSANSAFAYYLASTLMQLGVCFYCIYTVLFK